MSNQNYSGVEEIQSNSITVAVSSSSKMKDSPSASNNTNIKERLNLHVKRRIQETDGGLSNTVFNPNESAVQKCSNNNKPTTNQNRPGKRSKGKHNSPTSTTTQPSSSDIIEENRHKEDTTNTTSTSTLHSPSNAREKDPYGLDLITSVLNEKKLSLMRDPEVIGFLENIVGVLRK